MTNAPTYTPPADANEAVLRMAQDGDADPMGTAQMNYPHLFPDLGDLSEILKTARDYIGDVANGDCFFFASQKVNASLQKTAKEDADRIDAALLALDRVRGLT